MTALVPKPPMELVDPQAQIVVDFLKNMGLPYDTDPVL